MAIDPSISLIIPTYKRPAALKRALESALNSDYQPSRFEVIVVDNGSSDTSLEVVRQSQANSPKYRVRYLREARLGLHNARHAGVWAAGGELLVFTDDDATFDRSWLRAYSKAFERHPEMAAAGGPVRPAWDVPPPKWLVDFIGGAKSFGMLSLMEPYDDFRLDPKGIFFGVNMAVRTAILKELGGFNPDSFGAVWLGDGETGLNHKLWDRRMLVGYVPDAVVFHHIPAERMTVEYLRKRMANQGACDLYSDFHRRLPHAVAILGRLCRLALRNAPTWVSAALVNGRTDIRSLQVQLEADRTKAQLKYMLRIALDKDLRAFVVKKDWLEDFRPPPV